MALQREPSLLGRMARVLLDLNFPPPLHEELCGAVGLELEAVETGRLSTARRQRDRRMRELVLTAYEYQCAFCGYDGSIGAVPVGLEAAHVRWWAFDGPDEVDNGLCLCSLHHRLFDKGVLGIGNGHRILVSQGFVGRSPAAREHVIALAGRPLIGPQPGVSPIAAAHRSWHTSQVFHGTPRLPQARAFMSGSVRDDLGQSRHGRRFRRDDSVLCAPRRRAAPPAPGKRRSGCTSGCVYISHFGTFQRLCERCAREMPTPMGESASYCTSSQGECAMLGTCAGRLRCCCGPASRGAPL